MSKIVKKFPLEEAVNWLIPEPASIQLIMIDGLVYVSIDEDADMSEMPDDFPIETVDLSDNAILHMLRSKSGPSLIINSETVMSIRSKYSPEDEVQAVRESNQEVLSDISDIVAEGALKKDALGMVSPEQ